jgi:hypothetical protein
MGLGEPQMPTISKYYFRTAILFLIAGIMIGLHMSISQDHAPAGAHAHINLLGWVTMSLFGGYLALHPAKASWRLTRIQFFVYTAGVLVMTPSLYLLLTGNPQVEPLLAAASMVTFAGVLLFAVIVFREAR